MVNLHNEMVRRFPEVRDRVRDYADLPYVLMSCLAEWLAEQPLRQITPELVGRVVTFARWCEEQPRGDTATDDLYTILVVGFFEHLFQADTTRALLPKVMPRDLVVNNADYLKTWVGEENYSKALTQYAPNA
jgi:hypothetical protein